MADRRTEAIKHKVGVELRDNPPRILAKTKRKKGSRQAEKQRRAIFLSKVRKSGGRV